MAVPKEAGRSPRGPALGTSDSLVPPPCDASVKSLPLSLSSLHLTTEDGSKMSLLTTAPPPVLLSRFVGGHGWPGESALGSQCLGNPAAVKRGVLSVRKELPGCSLSSPLLPHV